MLYLKKSFLVKVIFENKFLRRDSDGLNQGKKTAAYG